MINFLKRKSKWGFEYCEDSMTSLVFESLTLLISENDINCQLQGLNELYPKEVAQKCRCMIKPIFNLDSSDV